MALSGGQCYQYASVDSWVVPSVSAPSPQLIRTHKSKTVNMIHATNATFSSNGRQFLTVSGGVVPDRSPKKSSYPGISSQPVTAEEKARTSTKTQPLSLVVRDGFKDGQLLRNLRIGSSSASSTSTSENNSSAAAASSSSSSSTWTLDEEKGEFIENISFSFDGSYLALVHVKPIIFESSSSNSSSNEEKVEENFEKLSRTLCIFDTTDSKSVPLIYQSDEEQHEEKREDTPPFNIFWKNLPSSSLLSRAHSYSSDSGNSSNNNNDLQNSNPELVTLEEVTGNFQIVDVRRKCVRVSGDVSLSSSATTTKKRFTAASLSPNGKLLSVADSLGSASTANIKTYDVSSSSFSPSTFLCIQTRIVKILQLRFMNDSNRVICSGGCDYSPADSLLPHVVCIYSVSSNSSDILKRFDIGMQITNFTTSKDELLLCVAALGAFPRYDKNYRPNGHPRARFYDCSTGLELCQTIHLHPDVAHCSANSCVVFHPSSIILGTVFDQAIEKSVDDKRFAAQADPIGGKSSATSLYALPPYKFHSIRRILLIKEKGGSKRKNNNNKTNNNENISRMKEALDSFVVLKLTTEYLPVNYSQYTTKPIVLDR